MDLELTGTVVVLGGADGPIRSAIAAAFESEGARVVPAAASHSERAVAQAVKEFGRLDALVFVAPNDVPGRLSEVSAEHMRGFLDESVVALWRLARAAEPQLRASANGTVVVVMGEDGKIPNAGALAHSVAEAGMLAFVKSLCDDLGPDGVRVNAVCTRDIAGASVGERRPGEVYLGRSFAQQLAQWGELPPLGRLGTLDDVASAVVFLASVRARFVTGTNIDLDGGYQRMIV